jgi:hypothetical protein
MTALWGSLIVLGLLMILVASWPSIRSRKSGQETDEKAYEKAVATDQDGLPPGP